MLHMDIKRFTEEGFLRDDCDIIRLKDTLTKSLEEKMRSFGYIPHLDLNVEWSTSYSEKDKRYEFKISWYGIEVGVERSWSEIGFSEGKTYPIT